MVILSRIHNLLKTYVIHHEVHEKTRSHCFLLHFFVGFVIFVVRKS